MCLNRVTVCPAGTKSSELWFECMVPAVAEECPTLTNMLVIIVGGIPIAMPTVLSVTLALGAYKLARVRFKGILSFRKCYTFWKCPYSIIAVVPLSMLFVTQCASLIAGGRHCCAYVCRGGNGWHGHLVLRQDWHSHAQPTLC